MSQYIWKAYQRFTFGKFIRQGLNFNRKKSWVKHQIDEQQGKHDSDAWKSTNAGKSHFDQFPQASQRKSSFPLLFPWVTTLSFMEKDCLLMELNSEENQIASWPRLQVPADSTPQLNHGVVENGLRWRNGSERGRSGAEGVCVGGVGVEGLVWEGYAVWMKPSRGQVYGSEGWTGMNEWMNEWMNE